MQNPKPFDTKRFLIIATIMLAMWHGMDYFTAPTRKPHVGVMDAVASEKGLYPYNDEANAAELDKPAKPTLLFVYASWCGYCMHQHPIVDDFVKQHGNKVHVVAVSIDDNPDDLNAFLASKPKPLAFKPYIAAGNGMFAMRRMLAAKGGDFSGGIPYLAFFATNGQMTMQMAGLSDLATLNEGLARAQSVD